MILFFLLGSFSEYEYYSSDKKRPLQKIRRKSISNVRKSGVQISMGEVFKLAGVHTNTYNTNTYCRRFLGKDTPTR